MHLADRLDMSALGDAERDVLGLIAIGLDQGHPVETLARLGEAGLIQGHRRQPGGPVSWEVPLHLHIQWAEWCAGQPDDQDVL